MISYIMIYTGTTGWLCVALTSTKFLHKCSRRSWKYQHRRPAVTMHERPKNLAKSMGGARWEFGKTPITNDIKTDVTYSAKHLYFANLARCHGMVWNPEFWIDRLWRDFVIRFIIKCKRWICWVILLLNNVIFNANWRTLMAAIPFVFLGRSSLING